MLASATFERTLAELLDHTAVAEFSAGSTARDGGGRTSYNEVCRRAFGLRMIVVMREARGVRELLDREPKEN